MSDESSGTGNNPINFFISFSSLDLKDVRVIMSALKGQDIDFWDYSDEVQSIEAGKDIPSYLTSKIDICDYFVAIISQNSLNRRKGRFTRFEIGYAISNLLPKGKKIILIMLSGNRCIGNKLKRLFPALETVKYLEYFDHTNESYVRLQEEICRSAGKIYVPEKLAHKRLPVRKLFNEEVYRFAHNNAAHVDLSKIIGVFNRYYLQEELEKAHSLIKLFIDSCRFKIPDYPIVYPYIVKAVCEQDLGRHKQALQSYAEALIAEPFNPDALGGMGIVYMISGEFKKAKKSFLDAEKHSTGEQVKNEHLNYLMAKVSDNELLSDDDRHFFVSLDENMYDHEEKIVISIRKAVLYYHINEYQKTKEYFEKTGIDNVREPVFLIYYLYALANLGLHQETEIFIRNIETKLTSQNEIRTHSALLLNIARYYDFNDKYDRLNHIFKNYLLTDGIKDREIMAEYAKILFLRGEKSSSERISREILDSAKTGLPETKEDFFHNGLANYIIGNRETASSNFEMSGSTGEYYDKLLNH